MRLQDYRRATQLDRMIAEAGRHALPRPRLNGAGRKRSNGPKPKRAGASRYPNSSGMSRR